MTLYKNGDYVNKCKVYSINGTLYINDDNFKQAIEEIEIKAIVTKEYFELLECKIED